MSELGERFERTKNLRVLVLGDIMLDRYTWGDAARVSPEAPVLVLRAEDEEVRLRALRGGQTRDSGVKATAEVLRVVGAGHTSETRTALKEFPVIHKVKPDDRREFAFTDAEKSTMFQEVEGLADWMERLGYLETQS